MTDSAEAGLAVVKGGTLYPLLSRLAREDLVEATWRAGDGGPGRNFFQLTAASTPFVIRFASVPLQDPSATGPQVRSDVARRGRVDVAADGLDLDRGFVSSGDVR